MRFLLFHFVPLGYHNLLVYLQPTVRVHNAFKQLVVVLFPNRLGKRLEAQILHCYQGVVVVLNNPSFEIVPEVRPEIPIDPLEVLLDRLVVVDQRIVRRADDGPSVLEFNSLGSLIVFGYGFLNSENLLDLALWGGGCWLGLVVLEGLFNAEDFLLGEGSELSEVVFLEVFGGVGVDGEILADGFEAQSFEGVFVGLGEALESVGEGRSEHNGITTLLLIILIILIRVKWEVVIINY